jgi:AcrR family transcriptional regulator
LAGEAGKCSNAAGENSLKPQKLKELGLREQHKLEKRQRIRAAVRALFTRHGYETATLRQIAKRANVGLGTLFNYAQDKRDLVFLVFNEELTDVHKVALRASKTHERFFDQLMAFCQPRYEFFAKTPALSRILLKNMTFYSEGKQAAEYLRNRSYMLTGLEEMVRAAQQNGQIKSDEDASYIARHIFLVYAGAVRWWIARPRPNPREGVADLKRIFELQINGLKPALAQGAKPAIKSHGAATHAKPKVQLTKSG